jgi:agmatine/peptidylarginine deiminase
MDGVTDNLWRRCRGCDFWHRDMGRSIGICTAGRGQTHEDDYHVNCWTPIVRTPLTEQDREKIAAVREHLKI